MNFSNATVEPFMGHWLTLMAILIIVCGIYFGVKSVRSNIASKHYKNTLKETEKAWKSVDRQFFHPAKLISLSFGALCIVTGSVIIIGLQDKVTEEERILLLNEQC